MCSRPREIRHSGRRRVAGGGGLSRWERATMRTSCSASRRDKEVAPRKMDRPFPRPSQDVLPKCCVRIPHHPSRPRRKGSSPGFPDARRKSTWPPPCGRDGPNHKSGKQNGESCRRASRCQSPLPSRNQSAGDCVRREMASSGSNFYFATKWQDQARDQEEGRLRTRFIRSENPFSPQGLFVYACMHDQNPRSFTV